jgi:hypothetical protein
MCEYSGGPYPRVRNESEGASRPCGGTGGGGNPGAPHHRPIMILR